MSFGVIPLWAAALVALALCFRRGLPTGRRALTETGSTLVRILPVMVLARRWRRCWWS